MRRSLAADIVGTGVAKNFLSAISQTRTVGQSFFDGENINGMKKTIRVSLAFANYTNSELNSFAILAILCLKTNPLFPNLPVTIASLTALQVAFQDALTAAAQGGVIATAAKNEAADALVVALRQIAGYISSLAPTLSLSQVLSSGFDVVNTNRTPVPLTQPIFSLDNSVAGQLAVSLSAVTNAKAYQVQYTVGTSTTWLELGIFPNTKGIVLPNTTAGTVYNVRIRAVGGSTGYSDWSATVSLMSM